MMKSAVAHWALAWLLITVIGMSLAPASTQAMPLKTPESIVVSSIHAVGPVKHPPRHTYRLFVAARVCRDTHNLRMGIASWYGGTAFHRTASGEMFHANELAAASRMLPFNTRVRVINLRNGRSVVVRINDRGPFIRGRIIDVTPRAAIELGMKAHGTAPVYLEIVRREVLSTDAQDAEIKGR